MLINKIKVNKICINKNKTVRPTSKVIQNRPFSKNWSFKEVEEKLTRDTSQTPDIGTLHGEITEETPERLKSLYASPAVKRVRSYLTAPSINDKFCQHKQLINMGSGEVPKISTRAFVAPSATIVGNVEVWARSSVWYNVVINAKTLVRIGTTTNIQDNTTITDWPSPLHHDHDGSTMIGHYVTIGHSCHLVACTVEDESLVGMGSVLCKNSTVSYRSILGAGSVLREGQVVNSGELWMGNPAKFVRYLTDFEMGRLKLAAQKYNETAKVHNNEFFLPTTAYQEAEKQGFGDEIGWRHGIPIKLRDGTYIMP